MGHPVKFTAVNDSTAYSYTVTVHVFGGGMGNDICSPFDWTTVYRCREGIVHDQRHAVRMGCFCKFLNIQYSQRRVGNRLTKAGSGILFECRIQFFFCAIRIYKCYINPHLSHGHVQKIEGTAVDRGRSHYMAACLTDIKNGKKAGRLSGRCQHGGSTAL